jgi:antitoxin component YwqK of YwqJK toxin-antitoxin module
MKRLLSILITICGTTLLAQSQTWEVINNDTCNRIDMDGKKQGKWILLGKHKPGTCYKPDQEVEKGLYQDNRKTGVWVEFYCNGNMKNKLTFANGRPDGYAIMYGENGKITEEGNWKINKWVGNYKLYYENGQVQHEFVFNPNGKREGAQKYYYENGQTAIEGNFVNGRESGLIKEYHENGDIKAEKNFADGSVDEASIKLYEPKKPIVKKVEGADNAPKITVSKDEAPNEAQKKSSGPMVLNGQHTLYNKNKQITKDGIFQNNTFMEGKAYFYNDNGILTRIAVYKNGVYIGDTQADK